MNIINIFTDKKTTIEENFKEDKSILKILQNNKVYIDAPCNGNGTCGKCKVRVTGIISEITDTEKNILSLEEINDNIRLACKTYPLGDCDVHIINDSEMGVVLDGALDNNIILDPYCDISLSINPIGLAVDIGTTTVACYFYNLKTGEKIATFSGLNEQRSFGADVISRINSCITDDLGLEKLKSVIVNELNDFIDEFVSKGFSHSDILDVVISANTVMLHMLSGLSPNQIAVAPFTPTSLFDNFYTNKEIPLKINDNAKIYLTPCISGYVGGDITAGILSSKTNTMDNNCIYIDIGTNGEIAVGNKESFTCCATAAGPAFEGAHIKYGVGGIEGAINSVSIKDNDICFTTINNMPPIGICGSGLIDCIAVLLELGVIDETGRIDEDEIPEHLMYRYNEEDEVEFIIDLDSKISITQKDVREIQLAKAAINAGIKTLLHVKQLDYSQLDLLVLAGGFGSFINKDSACKIGLLPYQMQDKIKVVGNAAGMGAVELILSKESRKEIKRIKTITEYFELSGDKYFQDEYINEMCF